MPHHVEFSAVTENAIYNVRQNHDGIYIVIKIYKKPRALRSTHVGFMFLSAPFLALTSAWGIFPYNEYMCLPKLNEPEKNLLPENVPDIMRRLVPRTSSIQAIFLREATAHKFIELSNEDQRTADWTAYTKAVLQTIDTDDPFIRISHDEKIGFTPDFF